MKFKEIANRLTGISTPIFGVSWNPAKLEVSVAREVITFLEDRRVLYNPHEMESPDHCMRSVLQIRSFLTEKLVQLGPPSELQASLRAMRAACRKFLNSIGDEDFDKKGSVSFRGLFANWVFSSALGELRGVFGIHIARLATQHGLDVEDQLAAILPSAAE